MDLQISPELIRNLFNYFIAFYWFTAPIVFLWCLFTDEELTDEIVKGDK